MAIVKHQRLEEEEESIFVSMTDLMISILVIVMILMAFFAMSRSDEEVISLADHQAAVSEMEKIIEIKQSLLKSLLSENAELRAEIDALMLEESDLRAELARSQNREDNLNFQNARLRDENEALRSRLVDFEDLENMANDLVQVAQAVREENTRLRGIIADLETRLADLQAELDRLRDMEDVRLSKSLENISDARRDLLNSIQMQLSQSGINVKVDPVSGVIRFDESVIRFGSGSYLPSPEVEGIMRKVAEILDREVQCYTLGSRSRISRSCNRHLAVIEAIQVEGHTDDVPMRGRENLQDNLDLSAKRAAETYRIFTDQRPNLLLYQNANHVMDQRRLSKGQFGQPVLSMSGYGSSRPVEENSVEAREANRRIDLRFIMTTPKSVDEADMLLTTVAKAVTLEASR